MPPSEGAAKAAEAALRRLNLTQPQPKSAIKIAAQREIEKEKRELQEAEALKAKFTPTTSHIDKPSTLSYVSFWCPVMFGDSVIMSYADVNASIQDYLLSSVSNNPKEGVILLLIRAIETSHLPASVDTTDPQAPTLTDVRNSRRQNFVKLLKNIIEVPEKEAFRRLRVSNVLIVDLLSIDVAEDFLNMCGFARKMLPKASAPIISPNAISSAQTASSEMSEADEFPAEEAYLVMPEPSESELEHLKSILELFETAQPIVAELYRNTQIFSTTGKMCRAIAQEELPDEFFVVSKDELRRIQLQQQRVVEESGLLLTKAMRDRMQNRDNRFYRFAAIRIRFPNDIIIQGTFYASDNLATVRMWITDCLQDQSMSYQLLAPPGILAPSKKTNAALTTWMPLEDNNATIVELGLAPSTMLNLSFVNQHNSTCNFIKADLMAQARIIT